jgi:L-alanine-DL-glutamate epimerase-like enolase superfamily enzyme
MKVRILEGEIRLINLRTRMPFKYGIATMNDVPYAFMRLRVEINGQAHNGYAADNLPPKWFTKVPEQPLGEEMVEMLRVIENARKTAIGMEADSPFELWQDLADAQSQWGTENRIAPLLYGFGTSMVERALIEACCRSTGKPFATALHDQDLGLNMGAIQIQMGATKAHQWLPKKPLSSIIARHTVGLADPLTPEDIPDDEKVADSLPQALTDCISAYGLRHFKIKVNGQPDTDLARLESLAEIITSHAPADFAFSLDGNEQFKSITDFQAFWQSIQEKDSLRPFFEKLLFIEQPLHRDVALEESLYEQFQAWPDRPPVIIDESDATPESLPTALRLGYAGTSHKNCKGIFKGIANRCLIEKRSREGDQVVMSGEDLCNVGPIALLQDLAVCAALGIESVERNGHHYHSGLSQLPQSMQEGTLEHHADLYHKSSDGWPTLNIQAGRVSMESINNAPFGVGFGITTNELTPATDWEPPIRP